MNALYLSNCYLKEWEATVINASKKDDRSQFIVLDKTAFYPASGGQPNDTGTMALGDKVFKVVYSCKIAQNGTVISHEVESQDLKPGDRVKCKIDWDRRYKLMRMHTAAHIISAIIHNETGAMISGNQLGLEQSRIDFSVPEFDRERLKSYEEKANDIVRQAIKITFETKSRSEALKDPHITKLAKGLDHLPPDIKEFRIVKIGDFDVQADGGTHVKNTKEVGRIEFTDFVNKGAKNRRIYFRLI